jgi:YHS domain-containing protein
MIAKPYQQGSEAPICRTSRWERHPGRRVALSWGWERFHPRSFTMIRRSVTSALTGAFVLSAATAALAATGQFDNMCAWGLANHKDVATNCSVNASIEGKTYCFSNAEAKANFMKNPKANLAKAESFYKSEHKG